MKTDTRGAMVATSLRDWWDVQWTVALGCTKISPGCAHCSAETVCSFSESLHKYANPRWTGLVAELPKSLNHPAVWAPGTRAFVAPLSDLFHEAITDKYLDQVLESCCTFPEHRFGFLTKRTKRAAGFFRHRRVPDNVWLGTSIENNDYLFRAADILEIEAKTHWVSVEPQLDAVDLTNHLGRRKINWVTCGHETGPEARPHDPVWARDLQAQCSAFEVPFFSKHMGVRGMPLD